MTRTFIPLFRHELNIFDINRTFIPLIVDKRDFISIFLLNNGINVRELLEKGHFIRNSGTDVR